MTKTDWTYEEILRELPAIIADSLGVDAEDIRSESNFYHDLGGDSIEELELSFRCEKAFGVKRGPFRALNELANGQPRLDDEGFIQGFLIERFCERYPFLRSILNATGHSRWTAADLKELFTVELIARLIDVESQR
jgi:acyl carrier protein